MKHLLALRRPTKEPTEPAEELSRLEAVRRVIDTRLGRIEEPEEVAAETHRRISVRRVMAAVLVVGTVLYVRRRRSTE